MKVYISDMSVRRFESCRISSRFVAEWFKAPVLETGDIVDFRLYPFKILCWT
jgi:hypothetical protein